APGVSCLAEGVKELTNDRHSHRPIQNDLGAAQSECARAFRKVTVVTDVNTDARECRVEARIAEIARTEVKLLPETGIHVRYVILAILAEVLSARIDHRGGVVVDAGKLFFINRH